jgi:hypothetical protein
MGRVVTITGRLDLREEGPRISANEVKPMKKPEPRESPVVLKIDHARATEADLKTIQQIVMNAPGKRRIELRIQQNGHALRVIPSDDFRIEWNPAVQAQLAPWL